MRSRWVCLIMTVLLAAACGNGGAVTASGTSTTSSTGPAAELPPVVAHGEVAPLLPDGPLPAGTSLLEARVTDLRPALVDLTDPTNGAQTLYVDPGDPDRRLLVARTEYSDGASSPTEDLQHGGELGEPVEVQGFDGTVAGGGDTWLVAWDLGDQHLSCACTQYGVVGGTGLSRAEVLAAANGARPLDGHPAVDAAQRPNALEPQGTVDAYLWDLANVPGASELVFRLGDDHALGVTALDGRDPRMATHVAMWNALASIELPGQTDAVELRTIEDAVVRVAEISGCDEIQLHPLSADAEAVLGSLAPATAAEVERADAAAERPEEPCD